MINDHVTTASIPTTVHVHVTYYTHITLNNPRLHCPSPLDPRGGFPSRTIMGIMGTNVGPSPAMWHVRSILRNYRPPFV